MAFTLQGFPPFETASLQLDSVDGIGDEPAGLCFKQINIVVAVAGGEFQHFGTRGVDELRTGFGGHLAVVFNKYETESARILAVLVAEQHISIPWHIGNDGADLQRGLEVAGAVGLCFADVSWRDVLEEFHVGQRVAGTGHTDVTQLEVGGGAELQQTAKETYFET